MRRAQGACSAGLAVLLAGCWPAAGQGPDRQAFNPLETVISTASVGSLDESWTVGPAPSGDAAVGSPIVSEGEGGGVHATIGGCAVLGVDLVTGQIRWLRSLVDDKFQMCTNVTTAQTPTAVDGEGVIAGRSMLTPDFNWEWRSLMLDPGTGAVEAVEDAGVLHGVRGDRAVFYRDTSPPWSFEVTRVATVGSLSDSTDRQEVVLDSFQGYGGAVEPELTLGDEMLFHAGPGALAVAPGSGSHGMGVRGFATGTGSPGCGPVNQVAVTCPVWATPIDGMTATEPVIGSSGDVVFVGTDAGTLYALDAEVGNVLWTATLGAGIEAPPALAYGTMYVPTADGRIVALAEAGCGVSTCPQLWESTPGAGEAIHVQPAVANGLVFTGGAGADGELRAFDAAGCGTSICSATWSTTTGSPITGAPAVSNGHLFIGTADGRLIAYTPT